MKNHFRRILGSIGGLLISAAAFAGQTDDAGNVGGGYVYDRFGQSLAIVGQTDSMMSDRTIDGRQVIRHARPRPGEDSGRWRDATAGTHEVVCDAQGVAWHGQPLPNGEQGTLSPDILALWASTSLNSHGKFAFAARVDGADRNQGIFTADADGLHIIVMGCGGGGGSGNTADCGDPSPIGGHFSGFFLDTHLTPDINDNGDVLFLADIHEGDSPRGLFLYRAGDDTIVKVAAVGDASPLGGTITEVGSASMNNHGTVALVARTDGSGFDDYPDILLWDGSDLSVYVAVGDAAPGGGIFWALATEFWGYADDTVIPGGPAPAINDQHQIAFRGYVDGGQTLGGLLLSEAGEHEWLVMRDDPTPAGNFYQDFQAPLLNNAGEIAFFNDAMDADGKFNSGWVVGSPDGWRQALLGLEEFEGGIVNSMAISRNPMSALNDQGDVVLWAARLMPDDSQLDTLFVSRADGERDLIAVQGQPTPMGGTYGSVNAWPAQNNTGQVRLGATTPGIPGQLSTYFLLELCPVSTVPIADISPDTFVFEVQAGGGDARILNIGNVGTADLIWSVEAAGTTSSLFADDPSAALADGCANPNDIAWLNVAPGAGITPPDDAVPVDVIVDTTGMAPGGYSGNLCIESNDPEQPLILVPIMLNVTELPPDEIFADRFQ